MKKNLVLSFLILFVLSTTAFAGFTDPKTESGKPAGTNPKENKLTDEELSRLTRRAETNNLTTANFSDNKKSELKKNTDAKKQIVRRYNGYGWYGGGALLLIILLIILLV